MKPLITAVVAGAQYLIHPQKLGTIQETIFPDALIPVTLLSTAELNGDLEGTLAAFARYDDVFVPDFGGVLVEKPGANDTAKASRRDTVTIKRSYQLEQAHDAGTSSASGFEGLPSGPYFLYGPNLYQAWKLYDDLYDAFDYGVIPENATDIDEFRVMSSLSPTGEFKSIAVPSRLYSLPFLKTQPLAGQRISVPDTFDLKGVATTLSSRAWTGIYDTTADTTADYVSKLIGLGAVIVGKTKTSQFTTGQEWVDAKQPWNPRGDGYQVSGAGAPGAAVALASYDWQDGAIGHGAIDDVRESAAVIGMYSLRSSANISSKGVRSISKTSDATGFLFRDFSAFTAQAKAFLGSSPANVTAPKKLIYPRDFHVVQSNDQQKVIDSFVATLENSLGVKADRVTIASVWDKKAPSEAKGQKLQDYLKDAPFKSFCYEFYHQFDEFRSDYEDHFVRQPYLEATPQFQWDTGKKVSESDYNDYQTRIKVFRNWFNDNIMSTTTAGSILVLPASSTKPQYRNEAPDLPKSVQGLTADFLAPILQTPQLVVPFGQLPYDSKITGTKYYRPVSASITGPQGSDQQLLETVQSAFKKAGWRAKIETEQYTFPLGDNDRHVDDNHRDDAPPPPPPVQGRSQEL